MGYIRDKILDLTLTLILSVTDGSFSNLGHPVIIHVYTVVQRIKEKVILHVEKKD